ncbi:MAG TPA: hypothetical protein VIX14_12140 [Terriglobales bacterium]
MDLDLAHTFRDFPLLELSARHWLAVVRELKLNDLRSKIVGRRIAFLPSGFIDQTNPIAETSLYEPFTGACRETSTTPFASVKNSASELQ